MDIIGLYYCNITHAKIILTNQKRVVDYISKQNKNIVKYLKKKYQYNRLDATRNKIRTKICNVTVLVID